MNLETASRLAQLRKQYGYSQEALAEKLGISRQAISKWERAESAPDTDNLIALARLYGITLDELLDTSRDKVTVEVQTETGKGERKSRRNSSPKKHIYPKVGKAMLRFPFALVVVALYCVLGMFLHIWHPAWLLFMLIPIYYWTASACMAQSKKTFLLELPVPLVCVMLYLIPGFFAGAWSKTWFIFMLIPIYYWLIGAFYPRDKSGDEVMVDDAADTE